MKKIWETTMRKLVVMMLIAVMALTFAGCTSEEVDQSAEDTTEETTPIGEGETVFFFTVGFEDGTENLYEVSTDATTVGEALLELGLIDGDDSEYGLYVTTVDGVTLDWDTDAAYWGFYINGEMAMSGVDTTDIEAETSYTLAYAQ